MWTPKPIPPVIPSTPRSVSSSTLGNDIFKRLVRIESKLHALAKALNVDLSQTMQEEFLHEERGNR